MIVNKETWHCVNRFVALQPRFNNFTSAKRGMCVILSFDTALKISLNPRRVRYY